MADLLFPFSSFLVESKTIIESDQVLECAKCCRWIWGYAASFCATYSPLAAEIKALKEGLQILDDHGRMCVIIESDSSQAASLFNGSLAMDNPELLNILECKKLHTRVLWSCSVVYTPRCSNTCVDAVTKLGYSLPPVLNLVMKAANM